MAAVLIPQLGSSPADDEPSSIPEPFQPPATVELATVSVSPPIRVPGRGEVVARFDADGVQYLVVREDFGGGVVWQRVDQDWTFADRIGLQVLDGVHWGSQFYLVGTSFAEGAGLGVVYSGTPGEFEPLSVDLGLNEVPYRVAVVGGSLAVFTHTVTGSEVRGDVAGSGRFGLWLTDDGETWSRVLTELDWQIFDILENSDGLRAFGADDGSPAVWNVTDELALEPLVMRAPDAGRDARILAAAALPSGETSLLVAESGIGTNIWVLDDRAVVTQSSDRRHAGIWDELVMIDGGLMAIPQRGWHVLVTEDGREWTSINAAPEPAAPYFFVSGGYSNGGSVELFGSLAGESQYPDPAIAGPPSEYQFTLGESPWTLIAELPTAYRPVAMGDTIEILASTAWPTPGPPLVRERGTSSWSEAEGLSNKNGFLNVVETNWGWVMSPAD